MLLTIVKVSHKICTLKNSYAQHAMAEDCARLLTKLNSTPVTINKENIKLLVQVEEIYVDCFSLQVVTPFILTERNYAEVNSGIIKAISIQLNVLDLVKNYNLNITSNSSVTEILLQEMTTLQTFNQKLISEEKIKDDTIPWRYKCSITGQIMDNPAKLPASNKYVEIKTISAALKLRPVDPFVKTGLLISDLVIDEALKQEISEYVIFDILGKDIIESINKGLKQDPGSAVEPDSNIGKSTLLVWRSSANSSVFITKCNEQMVFIPHVYPEKDATKTALKKVYHALVNQNIDEFDTLMYSYPADVRRYFLLFANKINRITKLSVTYSSESTRFFNYLDEERIQNRSRVVNYTLS